MLDPSSIPNQSVSIEFLPNDFEGALKKRNWRIFDVKQKTFIYQIMNKSPWVNSSVVKSILLTFLPFQHFIFNETPFFFVCTFAQQTWNYSCPGAAGIRNHSYITLLTINCELTGEQLSFVFKLESLTICAQNQFTCFLVISSRAADYISSLHCYQLTGDWGDLQEEISEFSSPLWPDVTRRGWHNALDKLSFIFFHWKWQKSGLAWMCVLVN